MSRPTVVRTPCKVNLHLGIYHEVDARGYHRVDSVMVPVSLWDVVTVDDAPELAVSFEPALEVGPEKTGVWRATALLAAALGREPRVRVQVETHIPERAGLGGSSADAGATLRALCERWGADPLDGRVVDVARRIGADVPFFLRPEPALFRGAGDVLDRALPCPELALALVMPRAEGGSTPAAYAEFDRSGGEPADSAAMCDALVSGDVRAVAAALANNLAGAARALCPEAGEVEAWLRAQPGVLGAQITGSGTCSFAICESSAVADAVAADAAARGWRSWSTKAFGTCAEVC